MQLANHCQELGDNERANSEIPQMPFSENAQSPSAGSLLPSEAAPTEPSHMSDWKEGQADVSGSTSLMKEEAKNISASRKPVTIPSTGKKSKSIRPPQGRRVVIHSAVTVLLVVIVIGTLAAVIPVDTKGHTTGYNLFNPIVNIITSKNSDTSLISAQAATATAVTQDGYEYNGAGGSHRFAGVDYSSSANLSGANFNNPFTPGQCTYWADYRYHQLTGYAVPWTGNAMDWSYNAQYYPGWVVSSKPIVPSIMVLQPGVQHASSVGHVGIVERINSDGSVYTSNWNIVGYGVLSYATYWPGPGVAFVYHV